MSNQVAKIEWRDGVPISTHFNDPYYSLQNGLAETQHVFLAGNDLPHRFRPGFHIAELGFGTGLNLLATWQAWLDAGIEGPLYYTSFELYPLASDDLKQALAAFPDLALMTDKFLQEMRCDVGFQLGNLQVQIVVGDVRQTLPNWEGSADAWFLDGFAPSENPEMWEADLMNAVAARTNPGGTFATFTAAGMVRRGLQAAGFQVERKPGYGRKRHMSVGTLV